MKGSRIESLGTGIAQEAKTSAAQDGLLRSVVPKGPVRTVKMDALDTHVAVGRDDAGAAEGAVCEREVR